VSPSHPPITERPIADDSRLVDALRRGDEAAFASLVDRYTAPLRRLALDFVRTPAVADEVVQETWLGVLKGIDRFEGRSSLKTWLFRILVNTAKTRGAREARTVPFSALEPGGEEAAVPEHRFRGDDDQWAGHWATPPRAVADVPEERLLAAEVRARISSAMETLPDAQRAVVTLRDVAGWDSGEVCEALSVSEGNQRVLLHRGRSKLRAELERYLEDD
jgi:RNA polymerase sigma-70 factor (ECF subfamily)